MIIWVCVRTRLWVEQATDLFRPLSKYARSFTGTVDWHW